MCVFASYIVFIIINTQVNLFRFHFRAERAVLIIRVYICIYVHIGVYLVSYTAKRKTTPQRISIRITDKTLQRCALPFVEVNILYHRRLNFTNETVCNKCNIISGEYRVFM